MLIKNKLPTIVIGSDHGGYLLKEEIKKHFAGKYFFIDEGCNSLESVDYPTYAFAVAKKVVENKCVGILVCTSGFGMCIAANKVVGIRAVCITKAEMAQLAKTHNDANVITLSGKYVSKKENFQIIENFMNASFSYNNEDNKRHMRRIFMISDFERSKK